MTKRLILVVTAGLVAYVATWVQTQALEAVIMGAARTVPRRGAEPDPIDVDQTVPRAAESPGEVPL